MSQFYDLASLVVIPSGYKASTIYAQKPLTTDGQLSFTRASTATRVNSSGLIEAVASNVPRLDYLGSSCPRLLLEGQRSNLITFSEQLDNASVWYSANTTITANIATSPDGTQNADRFATTAANGYFSNAVAVTISADASTYTQSVFVKWQSGSEVVKLRAALTGGTSVAKESIINIRTGVVVSTDTTAQVVSYGNGWYRISHQATNNSTNTTAVYQFYPTNDGTNTNVIYLWGAQLEAGSYATSYIPTLSASATRGADAASKTGISSLIGQTEGVAFIDFVWNGLTGVGSYPRIIELATDSNNIIQLYSIAGTTSWGWDIINGGVVQFTGSSTMALGRNKIAVGYKLNDMVIYKNGTLVASDATCTVPATSALGVTGIFNGTAGAQLAASVNQALLFKTRLTNAQLAELTTL
jgi:hypothetical protein